MKVRWLDRLPMRPYWLRSVESNYMFSSLWDWRDTFSPSPQYLFYSKGLDAFFFLLKNSSISKCIVTLLLASITIEITTYRLDNFISGILLELPVGIEPTLIDYKSIVLPLNYRSIWSKWRESNSHPQLGRLVPWPLCYTCITVPQRHSITKLNHFIASPRFVSLYLYHVSLHILLNT